ncbi:hypothetical protein BT69DRAFT_1324554 [Atractiella rhizophila]|nr:hypothetical protein BT69DRAFT_1324554 [Atractiella rhizophila]
MPPLSSNMKTTSSAPTLGYTLYLPQPGAPKRTASSEGGTINPATSAADGATTDKEPPTTVGGPHPDEGIVASHGKLLVKESIPSEGKGDFEKEGTGKRTTTGTTLPTKQPRQLTPGIDNTCGISDSQINAPNLPSTTLPLRGQPHSASALPSIPTELHLPRIPIVRPVTDEGEEHSELGRNDETGNRKRKRGVIVQSNPERNLGSKLVASLQSPRPDDQSPKDTPDSTNRYDFTCSCDEMRKGDGKPLRTLCEERNRMLAPVEHKVMQTEMPLDIVDSTEESAAPSPYSPVVRAQPIACHVEPPSIQTQSDSAKCSIQPIQKDQGTRQIAPLPRRSTHSTTTRYPCVPHISSDYLSQGSSECQPALDSTTVANQSLSPRLAFIESEVSTFLDEHIGAGFATGTSQPQLCLKDANNAISSRPGHLFQFSNTANLSAAAPYTNYYSQTTVPDGPISVQTAVADPWLQSDQTKDSLSGFLSKPIGAGYVAGTSRPQLVLEDVNDSKSSTPHPLLQASSVTNLLPMEHISSFKYRRQDSTVDRPTSAHAAVVDPSPTFRLALIENEVSAFLDQHIGPGFAAGTSLPQLRLEDANDTISSKPYALPQLSSTSNLLAAVPHTSSSKCLSQAAGQLSFADPTLQLDQSEIDSFFSALGNPPVEVDFAAATQSGPGPEDTNATVCTNPSSLPQPSVTATFPLVPITSQAAPDYPSQTFADYHPLLAAPIPALSLQDLDALVDADFAATPLFEIQFSRRMHNLVSGVRKREMGSL